MWDFFFSPVVHMLLAEVVGLKVPLPKCFFTPCLVTDCREAGLSYVLFLWVVSAFCVLSPSGGRLLNGNSGLQEP